MTNLNLATPVRDGRDPARVARQFRDRSDEVALNEGALQSAQREASELEQDIRECEKQIKVLGDNVPDRIVHKLNGLRFRLETAKNTQAVQLRISNSRREVLDRWLGEGSPTNSQLIEQDRALSAIAMRA